MRGDAAPRAGGGLLLGVEELGLGLLEFFLSEDALVFQDLEFLEFAAEAAAGGNLGGGVSGRALGVGSAEQATVALGGVNGAGDRAVVHVEELGEAAEGF